METTINERIGMIIDYSGLTLTAFSRKIGIAQTSLRDCVINNSEPKHSTLYKIIKAEPLISPEWLLMGTGDMILSNDNQKNKHFSENDNKTPIEAVLQIHLKGNRNGNGFSLSFSGGTLNIEGK